MNPLDRSNPNIDQILNILQELRFKYIAGSEAVNIQNGNKTTAYEYLNLKQGVIVSICPELGAVGIDITPADGIQLQTRRPQTMPCHLFFKEPEILDKMLREIISRQKPVNPKEQ